MPGIRRRQGPRPPLSRTYTTLGCPMFRNRPAWCWRACVPQEGLGACGRPAPHAMLDRYQRAILEYSARAAS